MIVHFITGRKYDAECLCGFELSTHAQQAGWALAVSYDRAEVTCPKCQLYIAFADVNKITLERPAELARRIIERVMEL